MKVRPIRKDLQKYLTRHNLNKKFDKQLELFKNNPNHPSLNSEILEPKSLKLYSFRIDRKYRVIFILTNPNETEIIEINDHYQ